MKQRYVVIEELIDTGLFQVLGLGDYGDALAITETYIQDSAKDKKEDDLLVSPLDYAEGDENEMKTIYEKDDITKKMRPTENIFIMPIKESDVTNFVNDILNEEKDKFKRNIEVK